MFASILSSSHSLRFPCIGALILAAALPSLGHAETGSRNRLDREIVEPVSQFIELFVDAGQVEYSGRVQIRLRVKKETPTFRFHAEEMQLTGAALTTLSLTDRVDLVTVAGDLGTVTATAPRPITPGDYLLTITFTNEFETRAIGLYRMEAGEHAYAFTQFEAIDARKAFPCWDEPSFKIPYKLRLVVPPHQMAVSNMPVDHRSEKSDKTVFNFMETPPLPSYLLAFATGPFATVPMPGMSIPSRIVTVKGHSGLTDLAAEMTPPILAALEDYFERPYPFAKLDYIGVPEYWPGAMEHPGAVTFAEAILLLDPASATFAQRRLLAMVIAHELAHMWFGDLVTMEWWDDLWLNEGFASWMATKITDQVFPEFQQSTATLGGIQRAMDTDALLASHPVRQPIIDLPNLIQSADEITFDKSEALIGMMERWLGAESFRQGMIAYMQAHEWGNATAADLWAALGGVSDAKTNGIDEIMATFLDRPGVPLVGVDLLPDSRIRLSQQRFLNYGVEDPDPDRLWQIPITLRYPDGDRVRTQRVLLTEKTQTFALESSEAPAWIHPNAGEHGYYRWQVAPSMFEKLARSASLDLDLRERLGLLDLLSALLDAGSLQGDAFLATLGHFASDPEPQIINGLAGQLARVRSVFVTEEMEEAFAAYVQRTLGPAWRHFGRQRVDGEPEAVSLARPTLMGFLGDEGRDREVLAYADSLARAYLETPSSVDPALSGVALALAATHGDRNLFETYRAKLESARVPSDRYRYLGAMGSFRAPEIVQLALDFSLAADLHLQEMYIIPFAVGAYPPFRDTYFEWVVRNYDTIAARIPPEFAAGLPRVAGGCSMERLEKARVFFSEPAHAPPGTELELAEVGEEVTSCVELREREGEAVRAYLLGAMVEER